MYTVNIISNWYQNNSNDYVFKDDRISHTFVTGFIFIEVLSNTFLHVSSWWRCKYKQFTLSKIEMTESSLQGYSQANRSVTLLILSVKRTL